MAYDAVRLVHEAAATVLNEQGEGERITREGLFTRLVQLESYPGVGGVVSFPERVTML